MHIKKIDNNKIKVFLNINDLKKNNIDINSFLSNSLETQNMFFDILDLVEKDYDFAIADNKAIVEAIKLNNNLFILTITKFKADTSKALNDNYKVFCFDDLNDIYNFYLSYSDIISNFSLIYKFMDKFCIFINPSEEYIFNLLSEYGTYCPNLSKDIILEYGVVTKN